MDNFDNEYEPVRKYKKTHKKRGLENVWLVVLFVVVLGVIALFAMPLGGTAMFALLALGGDIGCSGGPTWVGLMSGAMGDDLQKGILTALIFPVLMIIGHVIWKKLDKANSDDIQSKES